MNKILTGVLYLITGVLLTSGVLYLALKPFLVEEVRSKEIEPAEFTVNVEQNNYYPSLYEKSEPVKREYYVGYTDTRLNLRKEPNTESEIVEVLDYATPVEGYMEDGWLKTTYGYLSAEYLTNDIEYREYSVKSRGFKSFEPYEVSGASAFGKWSKQYKLQQMAWTDSNGLRVVMGRYCVALGSQFDVEVGQYFNLVLENGTEIPCVMADSKDDKDTMEDNVTTEENGCVSEFVVDFDNLNKEAKLHGNISNCYSEWDSPVVGIKIYNESVW